MTIRFTIIGNQENPTGNPIPYFRTTQRGKFGSKYKRYQEWKDHVRAAMEPEIPITYPERNATLALFDGEPRAHVLAVIWFGAETHADPDNIIKGILDSLFTNDSHVDVETRHFCHSMAPRVVVTINFHAP